MGLTDLFVGDVSIHTPPWGRDDLFVGDEMYLKVSIHTPPWGRDFTT